MRCFPIDWQLQTHKADPRFAAIAIHNSSRKYTLQSSCFEDPNCPGIGSMVKVKLPTHVHTTTTRVVGQIPISSSNLGRGRLTHLFYGSILPQQAQPIATTADALLSETCKAAKISTTTQRPTHTRDRPTTQVQSGWWQARCGGSSGPPTILLTIRLTLKEPFLGS